MKPPAVAVTLTSTGSLSPVRGEVRGQLAQWGRSDLAEDCLLVVSELVGNAFDHGRAPVRLSLVLRGQGGDQVLRIQVSDLGPGFDTELVRARWRHPSFGGLGSGGRGLLLVDALCRAWGERHERAGHTVWGDLPRNTT